MVRRRAGLLGQKEISDQVEGEAGHYSAGFLHPDAVTRLRKGGLKVLLDVRVLQDYLNLLE